jgi:hypothetical protein
MRLLRATLLFALPLTLLAGASSARADSFFEVLGGLSIPAGDNNWTNTVDTSPKLGVRAGAVGDKGLGGMVQADWTPENINASGVGFGVGSADVALHRFRILGNLVYHHPVAGKLILSARVGVGVDIAHASASLTVLGNTVSSSDTNAGFAFELGGGLWYDLGDVQVGGELALPVSSHSKHANGVPSDGNYSFDYTSYDFDLLFGVRLLSR